MQIQPFISSSLTETTESLQEKFQTWGYLYLEGALQASLCQHLLDNILVQLAPHVAWSSEKGHPILKSEPFFETDPLFDELYPKIQSLESFHGFFHHPELTKLMQLTAGEEPFVYPMKMARIATARKIGYETPPHQDAHSHQAPESMCGMWVALHNVKEDMGRLMVLPKSHTKGVRPIHHAQGVGGVQCEIYEDETVWHCNNVKQGDVIIFHACCVHKAQPNTSDVAVRISTDTRFCDYGAPLFSSNLYPHHGWRIPNMDWASLYEGWQDESLTYYWKNYPAIHGPSEKEWTNFYSSITP